MDKVASAHVTGLFGSVNHTVNFSAEHAVTIIAGPNGCGKTHLLRLIYAITAHDLNTLARTPFSTLELTLRSKKHIKLKRTITAEGEVTFEFSGKDPRSRPYIPYKFKYSEVGDERELPPWITQTMDGTWYDANAERVVTAEYIRRRYGIPVDAHDTRVPQQFSWLKNFFSGSSAIFIDTQRLDAGPQRKSPQDPSVRRTGDAPVASRISQYMNQIRAQITEARRASLAASQEADQSFAERVLEKARTTIKERDLKDRYQKVADQQAELHENGLSAQLMAVAFPDSRTNPTERRILNVFLDDWERRLSPLLPVNGKLKALRKIVEEKFVGKEMQLDARGSVLFYSKKTKTPLRVSSLSSGEQHLLAVFTLLLFSADSGSLVLIDEPEISMHAAWKHDFLSDISAVADINNLQIVLATHSSSIINGRWELVQEIGVAE
ncbi:ATP-binding protein [Streptomyces sp. NPDC013099]|uniref:ATP-binding protein n=1 Tax=Streptomyces sp. NPDC013099 TaxID=3156687 RepID=UPI0033C91280